MCVCLFAFLLVGPLAFVFICGFIGAQLYLVNALNEELKTHSENLYAACGVRMTVNFNAGGKHSPARLFFNVTERSAGAQAKEVGGPPPSAVGSGRRFCGNCGHEGSGQTFCGNCGAKMDGTQGPATSTTESTKIGPDGMPVGP